MSQVLGVVGVVVIAVGLILILLGAYLAVQDERARIRRGESVRDLEGTLKGLAALADALSKHPVSIRLIFLGIVLLIVGGGIAGVGSFTT